MPCFEFEKTKTITSSVGDVRFFCFVIIVVLKDIIPASKGVFENVMPAWCNDLTLFLFQ